LKAKHRRFLDRQLILKKQLQIDFDGEIADGISLFDTPKPEGSSVTVLGKAVVCEVHSRLSLQTAPCSARFDWPTSGEDRTKLDQGFRTCVVRCIGDYSEPALVLEQCDNSFRI
jgi:predicted aldo/keto reductase-like oxidoreductase